MPKPTSSAAATAVALLTVALAAPTPARADAPYAPPAPPGAAAPPAAWTRVHIVSPAPAVVLERRVGLLPGEPPPPLRGPYADGEPRWQAVCPAPCDTAVQLGGEYRIGGDGVTSSSPFALHGPATELRVDAGSYGVRRAGVYLTVIGFLGATVGGIFLAVAAVRPSGGLGTDGYASIGGLVGGGVLGLVGVGMIVGGGTSVRDEARRDLARIAPPSTLHATFHF